jgi:hypothetical protein
MIEVLRQAYKLLLTEPHAPTVCDQLEVIFRQAIAELESQEPVAWVQDVEFEQLPEFAFSWVKTRLHDKPLYTHPPQCTWVGLTKEEVDSWELPDTPTVAEFAWFVEAKLKQLNT